MRYGLFTICTHSTSFHEKRRQSGTAPKRRITFLHVIVAQKTLYFVEIAETWEKRIALLAAYKPYIQSAERILSILVT